MYPSDCEPPIQQIFVTHTIQPQLKSIHISQYEESAALGIIKM